jgi:5-methylcytosine-specific restriction enzyme A
VHKLIADHVCNGFGATATMKLTVQRCGIWSAAVTLGGKNTAMPRAPKICAEPGCAKTCPLGARRCEAHKRVGKWQTYSGTSRTAAKGHVKNRAIVLRREQWCYLAYPGVCTKRSTVADHVIPLSAGGADDLGNLRGCCEPCHRVKTSQDAHRAMGHNVLPKPPRKESFRYVFTDPPDAKR